MSGSIRIARRVAAAVVAVALLASMTASAAAGTSMFAVRLEAGPHPAVTFGPTWTVTATRSLTLTAPAMVTGSARVYVPARGAWLKVASGSLRGWWVAENRTSYVPGIVGNVGFAPSRTLALAAGRYELYRFGPTGSLLEAKGLRLGSAVTLRSDRTAVVNGSRYARVAAGAWAGWWLPGPVTSPQRITCTAGSPPTGTTGRVVRSVPAATGEIALTFDMGGRLVPAMSILRYLELERVCATIFPTGDAAQTTIGRQVMAEVKAHPELFELGNHTVHHCNLRDGGGGSACPIARPTDAFVRNELTRADAVITGLAGRSSKPYWRPPYGAADSRLVAVAASAGYPYMVMWSTDTIDWRPVADGGPTAAGIAAKVIAGRTSGGIVLMHLGGYATREALPAMLTGLRAAGYAPTTISALYR